MSQWASEPIRITIGTISDECVGIKSLYHVEPSINNAVLSAMGLITIRAIQRHVWDLEPTSIGKQFMQEPYAHSTEFNCDYWVAAFTTSKFHHMQIIGIVEEGVHARVDASLSYAITPFGAALMKQASDILFQKNKKEHNWDDNLTRGHADYELEKLMGDLAEYPRNAKMYVVSKSFTFEKYDDGWKLK